MSCLNSVTEFPIFSDNSYRDFYLLFSSHFESEFLKNIGSLESLYSVASFSATIFDGLYVCTCGDCICYLDVW